MCAVSASSSCDDFFGFVPDALDASETSPDRSEEGRDPSEIPLVVSEWEGTKVPASGLVSKYAEIDTICNSMSLPDLNSVIEEYQARQWNPNLCWHIETSKNVVVGGYERPDPEEDEKRLLFVGREYLKMCDDLNFLSKVQGCVCGFFQRVRVESKAYIRADIHGDLVTPLALFKHFKELGLVDGNYICAPGVKLFFLGDFMDRGANDIEVLTLFLLLKIKNPDSVFLFKGNHEDPALTIQYSSDEAFFSKWFRFFMDIFDTFPVCTSCEGEIERIYLAHATFSPTIDLRRSSDPSDWKVIPVQPKDPNSQQDTSYTPKQQAAIAKLRTLPADALEGRMVNWGDVGDKEGFSVRETGYTINAKTIHRFLRANEFKAMIRGHQHKYMTLKVKGKKGEKVVCLTLPAATAANAFKDCGEQPNQGILIEPRGKLLTWRIWFDRAQGKGRDLKFKLDEEPKQWCELALV